MNECFDYLNFSLQLLHPLSFSAKSLSLQFFVLSLCISLQFRTQRHIKLSVNSQVTAFTTFLENTQKNIYFSAESLKTQWYSSEFGFMNISNRSQLKLHHIKKRLRVQNKPIGIILWSSWGDESFVNSEGVLRFLNFPLQLLHPLFFSTKSLSLQFFSPFCLCVSHFSLGHKDTLSCEL